MRAFVLIRCEVDSVLSAVESIGEIDGVVRIDAVTGKYDAVAEVDVEDSDGIRGIVAGEVHAVEGVKDTATCIAT